MRNSKNPQGCTEKAQLETAPQGTVVHTKRNKGKEGKIDGQGRQACLIHSCKLAGGCRASGLDTLLEEPLLDL